MEKRPPYADEIRWTLYTDTIAHQYARAEVYCPCGRLVVVPEEGCVIRCHHCDRRYRTRLVVEVEVGERGE